MRRAHGELVPHYRLVADHGLPEAEFDAVDDQVAETRARGLSVDLATVKAVGFRLERQHPVGWTGIASWVPRRIYDSPGGLDALIQPHSSTS
jgi:hypothetical protein